LVFPLRVSPRITILSAGAGRRRCPEHC
jgi:hypothetical protein